MDVSPLTNKIYNVLWIVIPVALILGIIKTSWVKRLFGEAMVKMLSWLMLNKNAYQPFHNIKLPTSDGTTQIDHVYLSSYGIFVVETKNMKGWIFGREDQKQWTQKIFKKSIKFQNPLRQNDKHIKALESALDVPADKICSVVTFVGESKFKIRMPPNVTYGAGFIRYIKSFREKVFTQDQVRDMAARIESNRIN